MNNIEQYITSYKYSISNRLDMNNDEQLEKHGEYCDRCGVELDSLEFFSSINGEYICEDCWKVEK